MTFVIRVRVVLLCCLLSIPCHVRAQQQPPQIPANVDGGVFTPDIQSLLRHSDTFRAQCARIAADRRVRVRVTVAYSVDGGGRAQTTFRRYRTGTLVADVQMLFGEDYRELLAHEFEHVIEQLDGVNLRDEVARGRAWEIAAGTFETRRAFLAGVQARREVEIAHAHAPAPLASPPTR